MCGTGRDGQIRDLRHCDAVPYQFSFVSSPSSPVQACVSVVWNRLAIYNHAKLVVLVSAMFVTVTCGDRAPDLACAALLRLSSCPLLSIVVSNAACSKFQRCESSPRPPPFNFQHQSQTKLPSHVSSHVWCRRLVQRESHLYRVSS